MNEYGVAPPPAAVSIPMIDIYIIDLIIVDLIKIVHESDFSLLYFFLFCCWFCFLKLTYYSLGFLFCFSELWKQKGTYFCKKYSKNNRSFKHSPTSSNNSQSLSTMAQATAQYHRPLWVGLYIRNFSISISDIVTHLQPTTTLRLM